jgi:hypothetical protein
MFECGPKGPDEMVCRRLVEILDCGVCVAARTLNNKKQLIEDCGKTARLLLEDCEKVIVVWDLHPPWRNTAPCLKEDREKIFSAMEEAGVDLGKVALVCIHEELEAWLVADDRALTAFIRRRKHPHPVGRIPRSWRRNPDHVSKPKTKLTQLFQKELGGRRRYIDYQDAEPIAALIQDTSRLRRSPSFTRFMEKVCDTN